MDFGLLTEGKLMPGQAPQDRYTEVLREAQQAEQAGFSVFGASEQHFFSPACTVSAPEMLLAAAAKVTSTIRLRTASLILPLRHPLRSAEQVATLDLISEGRAEFGTGRGNNAGAADAYQIDVAQTPERWEEAIRIAVGALSSEEFSYEGEFWNIPPVTIAPRPVQRPHPPLWYAAVSPDAHRLAGSLGIGLMSLTVGVPLDTVEQRIGIYKEALADATPLAGQVNDRTSAYSLVFCADTNEEAFATAAQEMVDYLQMSVALYEAAVKRSNPDVDFSKLKASLSDVDELDRRGMIVVGDPARCIELLDRYRAVGIDEIMIRMEGIEHKKVMRCIELLGEHVIPALQDGSKA